MNTDESAAIAGAPAGLLDSTAIAEFLHDSHREYHLPALGTAVVYRGRVLSFQRGTIATESDVPFSASSLFSTGSFSEIPLAATVLKAETQLASQLERPILDHLPYTKMMEKDGKRPTLHQLLSHTAGLDIFPPDWDDAQDFGTDELEATTLSISEYPLAYPPGSKRSYSTYSYDLAADVIQKITGSPFEEVIDQQLLQPLGLAHSTYAFREADKDDLLQPQTKENVVTQAYRTADEYPYSRANGGSHGFHSTLDDMARLLHILFDPTADEPEAAEWKKELLTRRYRTSDSTYTAYGWQVLKTDDRLLYEHSWEGFGLSGSVLGNPDHGFAIVTVTNSTTEFSPLDFNRQVWQNLLTGAPLRVNPPLYFAMGQQLAAGEDLAAVLETFEAQAKTKGIPRAGRLYLLEGLYDNLYRQQENDLANALERYIYEHYPEILELDPAEDEDKASEGLIIG